MFTAFLIPNTILVLTLLIRPSLLKHIDYVIGIESLRIQMNGWPCTNIVQAQNKALKTILTPIDR